ncbi:hypothetical protein HKX48_007417 [Thoreauomyces humboldtii]|nr:hypothetical protein HKX48_007417 [Thoreauomyces humboldtii]
MLPHTPSSAESGSGSQPSLEGTLTRVQQALTVWNGSLELAPASIEQSFQLLKRVLMGPASQGHHLMREQVTEWCGAMIWFTSRLEQYSTGHGAINVARLVDCGILKTGGEAMKPTTMRPLLDVCKHVVDAVVQVDPQPYCQRLIADIQKASTCYSVLSEMYNTYNSAYGTLIRRNPNPIIAEDDPVHRYGWLFFLAGAGEPMQPSFIAGFSEA